MLFLKNSQYTGVSEDSSVEEIKKEYGHWPFEGEGILLTDKEYGYDTITWKEARPICRLDREDKLQILGAVKYNAIKVAEAEGVWHPAHYIVAGFMSPSAYKKAVKELDEAIEAKKKQQASVSSKPQKAGFKKALDMEERVIELKKASKEERKERETAVAKALKTGKKRSEIDVQDLRDKEGQARGRRLFEMLKARQGRK